MKIDRAVANAEVADLGLLRETQKELGTKRDNTRRAISAQR
jgi:hypothetical protein